MKFQIVWSDFAEYLVDEIYDYYKLKASEKVARKLVRELINAPKILINNPNLGQAEELLVNRADKYRYLVHKNYKIFYSVDIENSLIKIADVFDTRQSPTLIIERNK